MTIQIALLVLALLCFFCAAVGLPPSSSPNPRIYLGWLGLFFTTLAQLVK